MPSILGGLIGGINGTRRDGVGAAQSTGARQQWLLPWLEMVWET